MPLTKSDLQQIGNVIDKKLGNRLKQELEPIKNDLETVKKDLNVVKKNVKYLKKTVDIIAKNYDTEDVKLQRRVRRIEEHLNLPISQ